VLRRELVEREAVVEGRLSRMRGAAEETLARMVVPIHTRMREAREGGEMRAMGSEEIEIGTGGPTRSGEEKLRHHPERHMDREEPTRRQGPDGPANRRERETSAGGAEEMAAVHEERMGQGIGDRGFEKVTIELRSSRQEHAARPGSLYVKFDLRLL
jgi:hypothetical protein